MINSSAVDGNPLWHSEYLATGDQRSPTPDSFGARDNLRELLEASSKRYDGFNGRNICVMSAEDVYFPSAAGFLKAPPGINVVPGDDYPNSVPVHIPDCLPTSLLFASPASLTTPHWDPSPTLDSTAFDDTSSMTSWAYPPLNSFSPPSSAFSSATTSPASSAAAPSKSLNAVAREMLLTLQESQQRVPNPSACRSTERNRLASQKRRGPSARGEEIFCPVVGCKATFTRLHNVQSHLHVHFGMKPIKCEESICQYRTAYPADLKRHQRSKHPKERKRASK